MIRSSYKIATVWGIPIKLHISLLILLPFLANDFGFFRGIMLEIGLFTSIALHELGHSIVAINKGCRVREILLMPIGGAAQMDRIPTKPLDEFLMALAGPAVSLILGVSGIFAGRFLARTSFQETASMVFLLGVINCGLVVFNLLPSFPMDGGRVLRALLSPKLGRLRATFIAARLGKFMATLFGIYGLFAKPTHWSLVAIAFFIYIAAGKEYQLVELQEMARRRSSSGGEPPPSNWWSDEMNSDIVTISPPPYEKGPDRKAPLRSEDDDDPFQNFLR